MKTGFSVYEDTNGSVYLEIEDENTDTLAVFENWENDRGSIIKAAGMLAEDPDCWKSWDGNIENWDIPDDEKRKFIEEELPELDMIAWSDWEELTGVHINNRVTPGYGGSYALGLPDGEDEDDGEEQNTYTVTLYRDKNNGTATIKANTAEEAIKKAIEPLEFGISVAIMVGAETRGNEYAKCKIDPNGGSDYRRGWFVEAEKENGN